MGVIVIVDGEAWIQADAVDRLQAWMLGAPDEDFDSFFVARPQCLLPPEPVDDLDTILAELDGFHDKPRYRVKAISERWAT